MVIFHSYVALVYRRVISLVIISPHSVVYPIDQWLFNKPSGRTTPSRCENHPGSMAMTQEPIDWRYLPYIRPIFQGYLRGYTPKTWPNIWYSTISGSWHSHWLAGSSHFVRRLYHGISLFENWVCGITPRTSRAITHLPRCRRVFHGFLVEFFPEPERTTNYPIFQWLVGGDWNHGILWLSIQLGMENHPN